MTIEINQEVFLDRNNLNKVNYLLNIFNYNRRYKHFCDYEKIKHTDIFQALTDIDKEIIEDYFNRAITQSSRIDYQVNNIDSYTVFNLDEAISFFNQPLKIIFENSLNDGKFLTALINNFPGNSKEIKRHKENRWLLYENAGGVGNIQNVITGFIQAFENLPKENNRYLRCFVLVDSDKEYPMPNPKPERKKLYDFLDANSIKYHELEKREIENYLPDETFQTIESNVDYIQAYLRLTPLQKDYIDIEKGFSPDKNFKSLSNEVQQLFNTVNDKNLDIFRKMDLKWKGQFKSIFPNLFLHETVTRVTLKSRVAHQNNPNELEVILDKITNHL